MRHQSNNNKADLQKLQTLLSRLSTIFIRCPPDKVDQEIQKGLQRIAETLDFDHVALGLVTEDGQDFYSRYRYCTHRVKPWNEMSLMAEGPCLTRTLLSGQPHIMHDVEELPDEATIDRESFRRYGIKAHLAFPFVVSEQLRGGMGFACASPRRWENEIIEGLRMISDVFANILERKYAMQALQAREAQMSLAAEAANIGLWVWNIPRDSIWATVQAKKLYGIGDEKNLNLQRFLDCLHPEDIERIKETLQQTIATNAVFRSEYRVLHPDSGEHWICARGRCFMDENGQPEKLMGASIDISEIRKTKIELEKANYDLKTALEEIIILKDQLQQENIYLRQHKSIQQDSGRVVYSSPAMRQIMMQIEQVAATPSSVLIIGETGTGKELLAKDIHEASPRKDRTMICVNCAAIPSALIESELFGREKGAYTGALSKQIGRIELAHGSTLFLDEIGELPLDAQAKLLRALQEKEIERLGSPKPVKVDVRVIAATNRNLSQEVAEGRFREDLYYRLNVFPIHVPPLRERPEDIPLLVDVFIGEFAQSLDKSIDRVANTSLQALCNYEWPGNIRELRNVIERSVILAKGPVLQISLPAETPMSKAAATSNLLTLEDVEREYILRVLETSGWRIRGQGGAAEILGLKPSTLESRMIKLGIRRPSSR